MAAAYGTYVYYILEPYLSGYSIPTMSPEFQMFAQFLGSLHRLKAYRTEWMILGERSSLACFLQMLISIAAFWHWSGDTHTHTLTRRKISHDVFGVVFLQQIPVGA